MRKRAGLDLYILHATKMYIESCILFPSSEYDSEYVIKLFVGNSWGKDSEGTGLGHGEQEEFYGCSDIAIGIEAPDLSSLVVNTPSPGRITTRRTTPFRNWNATPPKTTRKPNPTRPGRPQRPRTSRPGRPQRPRPSRPSVSQRPRPSRPGRPHKPRQPKRPLPEGQFKKVPKSMYCNLIKTYFTWQSAQNTNDREEDSTFSGCTLGKITLPFLGCSAYGRNALSQRY